MIYLMVKRITKCNIIITVDVQSNTSRGGRRGLRRPSLFHGRPPNHFKSPSLRHLHRVHDLLPSHPPHDGAGVHLGLLDATSGGHLDRIPLHNPVSGFWVHSPRPGPVHLIHLGAVGVPSALDIPAPGAERVQFFAE